VGRGELGLLPNDWAARDRSRRIRARDAIAVLLVIAVMLVIGAALYIYGPLPSIFPANCPGCIVNRP
jgi:hypothetical protein